MIKEKNVLYKMISANHHLNVQNHRCLEHHYYAMVGNPRKQNLSKSELKNIPITDGVWYSELGF